NVLAKCQQAANDDKLDTENFVKGIYAGFTDKQISDKIASLLHPEEVQAELEIIFQTVEGLHEACPNHNGDWYFTGNYPTPGGNRVANRAFMNYMLKNAERA